MLTIEGSQGEGGGQILRSSLELSLVTRQPFRLDHIRARRDGKSRACFVSISKPEQVSAVVADMQRFRGVIEGGFCVRRVESFLPETECRYFVVDGVAHAGHRRHSRMQHCTRQSAQQQGAANSRRPDCLPRRLH